MATSETATETTPKKIYPPVELPKCPHATEPPSPENYGDIITVVVGKADSGRTEWLEGQTKTINLTEDDPEVFRAFFHWISNGKLYARFFPAE
ncbi:hypothetical protein CC86DRAFT_412282 [Ophiobolus disseminans]|uniref:Uncharacterized protein n=1 Tax=Ophiobolus disseminans TaxID=1469910 RepID=A0A6A6ZH18_9PLEO|nr:hypothetical protein CC86DRAFT_412282 [Ophiobolus disseminans]